MTKAKPLSTDNSPNAIDPDLAAKLSELDRTDPIDVLVLASDNTAQTFEGVGLLSDEQRGEMNALLYEPDPSIPLHPDAPIEEHEAWAEKFIASRRSETAPEETYVTNPYLLESSTVLNDFRNEAHRAQLLLNQIDHEIEHLNADADYQIQRIDARRRIEVEQRQRRQADLRRIVIAAESLPSMDDKDQTNGE